MKKELDPKREKVVLGAGPVITSNGVILGKAYADEDIETILAQRTFYENIAKCLAEYRAIDNKNFDNAIASGYSNAAWAKGLERLVKKDPDKPRGRKASPKPNPSQAC